MAKKVSALLALQDMADKNKDVLSLPIDTNFKYARTGKDGWGEIHVAIPNHVIANIDKYVGALYLANKDQYAETEKDLEQKS